MIKDTPGACKALGCGFSCVTRSICKSGLAGRRDRGVSDRTLDRCDLPLSPCEGSRGEISTASACQRPGRLWWRRYWRQRDWCHHHSGDHNQLGLRDRNRNETRHEESSVVRCSIGHVLLRVDCDCLCPASQSGHRWDRHRRQCHGSTINIGIPQAKWTSFS